MPAGVLNVVTGLGAEAGAALAAHPGLAKLSFTGSLATGRLVARAAAKHVVPCTLELGGMSPVSPCGRRAGRGGGLTKEQSASCSTT